MYVMTTSRKILIYGLYAVIVVGLGLAIVLALTHESGNKVAKSKAPTSSQKTTAKSADQATQTPQQNKQDQPPAGNNSPSSQAAGSAARTAIGNSPAAAAPNSSDQLVKTGPGNMTSLFMATALFAGIAFHVRQLKRA